MTECMNMPGMGWMMWGMGLFWLLVLVALVLAIAASIKYLRSGHPPGGTSAAAAI